MRKYICALLLCTLYIVPLYFSSCSLDTDNEKMVPAYTTLQSYSDLQATAANLYLSPWYEFHKRMLMLGDARANNILSDETNYSDWNAQGTFNEAMNLQTIRRPWASLYNVITQADYIVDDYAPYCVKNNICTQEQADAVVAEAKFMRALAYYYLGIYWHNVPIVDNATTIAAQARSNTFEDVMLYAIRDAEFAAANLSDKPYEVGRVSRITALTLLSRLYLTIGAYANGGHTVRPGTAMEWFAKADSVATLAITDASAGGYGLMDDYEQMFRVQNNNCKEVLFAIQFVAHNQTTGLANDLGQSLCYSYCLDNRYGKAWSTRAGYDFLNLCSMRGGMSRTRGNVFLLGTSYDYLYHEMEYGADKMDCRTDFHTPDMDGATWVVDTKATYTKDDGTIAYYDISKVAIKKQVVGGPLATGGVATNGNSGFCTPMIRLAEAYLNQSEARLMLAGGGDNTDPNVLSGINTIRRRAYKMERERGAYGAGLAAHDYTTINLDTLLHERRLEFFCEGTSWADIVRMSFYSDAQLQKMIDYNNNHLIDLTSDPVTGCYRQYTYTYKVPDDVTTQIGIVVLGDVCRRASRECTKENLWAMIYPPSEVSLDPNLKLDPVPYDFGE